MATEWQGVLKRLEPYVLRVSIGSAQGSGFVVESGVLASAPRPHYTMVATAWHVLKGRKATPATPLTNEQRKGGGQVRSDGDGVAVLELRPFDAALIRVLTAEPLFEGMQPPSIARNDELLPPGSDIGWYGFPGIVSPTLCFFSGVVSGFHQIERTEPPCYLVDGVAISGVSGGPAFDRDGRVIGLVTGYIPNNVRQNDGGFVTLPGLSYVVVANVVRLALERSFTRGVPNHLLHNEPRPPVL